jgi:hypothetical protein
VKGYGPDGADKVGERTYSSRTVSGAVASPPYLDGRLPPGVSFRVRALALAGQWDEAIALVQKHNAAQVERGTRVGVQSPEAIRRYIENAVHSEQGYGGAVASPPYGDALSSDSPGGIDWSKQKDGRTVPRPNSQGQIPNSYSADAAVASPPYCGHVGHPDADEAAGKGLRVEKRQPASYTATGTDGQQIANLRDPKNDIDAVLSSPPYEASVQCQDKTFEKTTAVGPIVRGNYGEAEGQIGQMEKETYCAAMLRVYQGLYAVLRPGGVVALVTKNPVKKGAIRRLDLDTIRLMQAAGFTFLERQRAMLAQDLATQGDMFGAAKTVRHERKSFFKRLFEKKYPHLRVDHEDVLWFRKDRV